MYTFIFLLICLLLMFYLLRFKPFKVIYIKSLIFPLTCFAFIMCLILLSRTAVSAALKGINLWLNIVFPSLFPFFVACELLKGTGFVRALGIILEPVMRPLFNVPGCASFTFAMGITSGYPVGAKITSEMRKEKLLSKVEAERLLSFSNNSGPLFVVGAVGVGMYQMPRVGISLLLCHIAACITVGILFRFYKSGTQIHSGYYQAKSYSNNANNLSMLKKIKHELLFNNKTVAVNNVGTALGRAVGSSIEIMLTIGGFIILFSVIINILLETGIIYFISDILHSITGYLGISKETITALISGFFEITTGTSMASTLPSATLEHKLIVTSMIISWAGLSVHSQVLSIISGTDISIKPYLIGKLLQGTFASFYTLLGIKIAGNAFLGTSPVFYKLYPLSSFSWYNYFVTSCKYLIAVILIFILIGFILLVAGILKHVKKNFCKLF